WRGRGRRMRCWTRLPSKRRSAAASSWSGWARMGVPSCAWRGGTPKGGMPGPRAAEGAVPTREAGEARSAGRRDRHGRATVSGERGVHVNTKPLLARRSAPGAGRLDAGRGSTSQETCREGVRRILFATRRRAAMRQVMLVALVVLVVMVAGAGADETRKMDPVVVTATTVPT